MNQPALPEAISAYLAASEARDVDAILACFSADAHVLDEGEDRTGHAEIRQWRESVDNAFEYTSTVTGVTELADVDRAQRYEVLMHLEGDFPGGRVDLINSFAVRDGHIVDLRIVNAAS